jgi:hypothetical protein
MILTDGNGATPYLFEKDTTHRSNCTGDCVNNWYPFTTSDELVHHLRGHRSGPPKLTEPTLSTATMASLTSHVLPMGRSTRYAGIGCSRSR